MLVANDSVYEMMFHYFGDAAKLIKRTPDLIPLLYAEKVIQQVMIRLLSDKPRTVFLTELDLKMVMVAFDQAMQMDEYLSTELFDRIAELKCYVEASRKILWKTASTEKLETIGNELLETVKAARTFIGMDNSDDIDGEPIQSPKSVKEENTEQLPQKDLQVNEDTVIQNDSPILENLVPVSQYSTEWREQFFKCYQIPLSSPISDTDIRILSETHRTNVNGYNECHPQHLLRMLAYSEKTLLNCCRDICKSVLPNHNNLDVEDRTDAVIYFNRLEVESLNCIYALCKCTSHQGKNFVYPTIPCKLCRAAHFHNHCMRHLTAEMRERKLTELGICKQCGRKQRNCPDYNNHPPNSFHCKYCRGLNNNHKETMCNCERRWLRGKHSTDGLHDLYVFANDMATIARATMFWTDLEWQHLHTELSNFYYNNRRVEHHSKSARNYYHSMTPAMRAEMDAVGFTPGENKYPESGENKLQVGALVTEPSAVATANSLSAVTNVSAQCGTDIITNNGYEIPVHLWARRMPTESSLSICLGARALLLNKKLTDKLLLTEPSSNNVIKEFMNLAKMLHLVAKNLGSTMDVFKAFQMFERECLTELKLGETTDVGQFFGDFFSYLGEQNVPLSNPFQLFCSEVYWLSFCDCDEPIDESVEPVTAFLVNLWDSHRLTLTEVVSSLFSEKREGGQCYNCPKNRTTIYVLTEIADVLIVRINRLQLSKSGNRIVTTKLTVDSNLVLQGKTQKQYAILQTVLCTNLETVVDMTPRVTRTYYINKKSHWFSYEGSGVTKVDQKSAREYCGRHGLIFIFRKSNQF